jgi:hypothetical protein
MGGKFFSEEGWIYGKKLVDGMMSMNIFRKRGCVRLAR